ncbi:MAG: UDP-2,3-diacylglucosamine diphosphatase [Bacteroidia bacterium]|nr:UDP-2,3-diacylglucosamine diphosphatase [Bacteroidia bacterium]
MPPKFNIKTYFVSDLHLGFPDMKISLEREKLFVKWLDEIKNDAREIYLMGDIFDVWFEYKRVVPRGFTRLLGKISEITDDGIPVHFFPGNHDHWITDYLPSETGVLLHRNNLITTISEKKFFLAHGDGLGPADTGYKFIKKIFNFAVSLAAYFSRRSRASYKDKLKNFKGIENEWLVIFAREQLNISHYDFFIFGHRHTPINIMLSGKTRFINLGDWLNNYTYAVFDGNDVELKNYVNFK